MSSSFSITAFKVRISPFPEFSSPYSEELAQLDNNTKPKPNVKLFITAQKENITPHSLSKQSRISYEDNITGTETGNTIKLYWDEGDIVRIYQADSNGNPVIGNGKVADFVLDEGFAGVGGDVNRTVEFVYDGELSNTLTNGQKYVAVAISASNKEALVNWAAEYPTSSIPSVLLGDAGSSTEVLSQCILKSVNYVTFIDNGDGTYRFDYGPVSGISSGILRFQTDFVIGYAILQQPKDYKKPQSNEAFITSSAKITLATATSFDATTGTPTGSRLSYIFDAKSGASSWDAGEAIKIFYPMDAVGDFEYLSFSVIDGYQRVFQATKKKGDGLVTQTLEPNTFLGRQINSSDWKLLPPYYMSGFINQPGGSTNRQTPYSVVTDAPGNNNFY